ncbi:MAG: ATP-dependent DNA helicase RecG [Deltaproteobacteria bacterium RBG_13_52_11]|nr:MAG: ATP-dependent DNA helicase RecG [Deltaproteobacteria bacterium RBG_13_52_11]
MAIQKVQISEDQKNKILKFEEGHFLDLKSVDITPAKLTRHISAFANADGGELYIGIDEDKGVRKRTWRGFPNIESSNAHLQVFEQLFPLGEEFSYTFLECSSCQGLVLQMGISKTKDIKTTSDGMTYVRRGAQSLPVDSDEALYRLRLNKGITSFEIETVSVEHQVISNSLVILKFLLDVIPTAEPEVWLKKQQLLRDEKPTVAGVLLFSEEPQAILPKRCSIKIYRYQTRDVVGTRETLAFNPITVEGCIYEQIKAAVSKTVELLEQLSILGEASLEKVSYPFETLHEIITNSVLHRDYSIADDIHIRIFENRIEVESPGRLPAHITEDNILEERFARNGAIVRLINKFPDPPNKDVGEGLNTAFEAMRKLRLKDPIIKQHDNSVLVEIRHEPLASPEEIVLQYLQNNPQINNTKGREICHEGSENVMKRVFERLIDRDLIERVPGLRGRASAYQKKSNEQT